MSISDDISQKIAAYYAAAAADSHHRYRSWEHCYRFFSAKKPEAVLIDKKIAALQLGFYLASWGMYRGSSFLLKHDYTVHEAVIEHLAMPQFSELWKCELEFKASDRKLVELILAAVAAVKEAYRPYGDATDTLATKVLLGTLACLPACDRFFIDGFKRSGRQYSYLNAPFVERIIQFCTENGEKLRSEQSKIRAVEGMNYPLMKLADMYFWQIGYEAYSGVDTDSAIEPP